MKNLPKPFYVFAQILFWAILLRACTGAFIDYDTFWHLKTGEWLVEHGHLPFTDPGFAIGGENISWHNFQWLSQIILYGITALGGLTGLSLVVALIPTFIFTSLYSALRRRGLSLFPAYALTVLPMALTALHWFARPHLLAYVYLLISLYCWYRLNNKSSLPLREGEGAFWGLTGIKFILFLLATHLVWTNSHQSFLLQFFFAACFLYKNFRLNLCIMILLGLVSLINPYGYLAFFSPENVVATNASIEEWQALPWDHLIAYLYLLYILLLAVAMFVQRQRLRLEDALLFIGAVVLSTTATRHVPVFVLITLPSLIRYVPATIQTWKWGKINTALTLIDAPSRMTTSLGIGLLMILLAPPLGASFKWSGIPNNLVPVQAVSALQEQNLSGNIFSDYAWGGYLLYKLFPASRVFIDGRADTYGNQRIEDYLTLLELKPGWQKLLRDHEINLVLGKPDWPLVHALRAQGWDEAFQDKQSVLLQQASPSP